MKNILITGGAGFLGIHLCDELISNGYKVTVLDNLSPYVHGPEAEVPGDLNKDVELVIGDVRDRLIVERLVRNADAVFHLAAIGSNEKFQNQIQEVNDVNTIGTSVLLEAIIKYPVQKLILASSMYVYGEGYYRDPAGNILQNLTRSQERLANKLWDFQTDNGEILRPIASKEVHASSLDSVYALTKYDQEKLCHMIGSAYTIPVCSLRYFNIYGPGQAFESCYSQEIADFTSRLLSRKTPLVQEDGHQLRDFIYISDAVKISLLALENDSTNGKIINVGSGKPRSILSLAQYFTQLNNYDLFPVITENYKVGEPRHCFADVNLLCELLGYRPQVSLEEGVEKMIGWFEDPKLLSSLKNVLY